MLSQEWTRPSGGLAKPATEAMPTSYWLRKKMKVEFAFIQIYINKVCREWEVVSIIEVRVWDWMKKKKKCNVSLEKPTQISYWLSLALLLKIDRKGWREWLSTILSFLKLRKAAPPEQSPPLFSPFNERPSPRFLFICGSGPEGPFFYQEVISRINQPKNP